MVIFSPSSEAPEIKSSQKLSGSAKSFAKGTLSTCKIILAVPEQPLLVVFIIFI
ncbi:MAG: Uncharacterised protein [Polaribacter sp. SA4-10]|nr:MAG: Uncharacterised protein [Polaribacter sp. SA4-10]